VLNLGQDGKFQAEASYGTAGTHRFGLPELPLRQLAITDREEHLWVLASAGRVVMPAHRWPPSAPSMSESTSSPARSPRELEMVLLAEVAVMADRTLRGFPLYRAASVT
jgi:hypothetical protein